MTSHVRAILHEMLRDTAGGVTGADIAVRTGVPLGPLHTILEHLERTAWVDGEWRDLQGRGRPVLQKQRTYRLTPLGREQAAVALNRGPAATRQRKAAALSR